MPARLAHRVRPTPGRIGGLAWLAHAHRLPPPVGHRDRLRARAWATSSSVGRHECDYPPEVVDVPVVTADLALGAGHRAARSTTASPRAPRRQLDLPPRPRCARRARAGPRSSPRSCATSARSATARSSAAVRALDGDTTVVSLEPHSIEGILNTISTVGAFAEAEDEAVGLIELLRERLAAIENRVLERRLDGHRRRGASSCLEWLDPPFASGHWVPEMVRRAGGWELLGREGERSVETTWERVREVDPEQLILAPCGFDASRAARELEDADAARLVRRAAAAVREASSFAVDGSGSSRGPGRASSRASRRSPSCSTPRASRAAGRSARGSRSGPVGIGSGPRGLSATVAMPFRERLRLPLVRREPCDAHASRTSRAGPRSARPASAVPGTTGSCAHRLRTALARAVEAATPRATRAAATPSAAGRPPTRTTSIAARAASRRAQSRTPPGSWSSTR